MEKENKEKQSVSSNGGEVESTVPAEQEIHVAGASGSVEEESAEGASDKPADVVRLEKELDEAKERMVRLLAESDNMRKRFARDKADIEKYALSSFLEDLLPVLDSFDKAIAGIGKSDADHSVLEGVELVQKMFMDCLTAKGLEVVGAEGQVFNPNIHQAIQKVEDEDAVAETVLQEFQKGYTLNGRLVRASMVSVQVPVKKELQASEKVDIEAEQVDG